MLVNSVMQSLDERLVLGKTSTKSISLLNVLKKSFEYATSKYNNGEKEYFKVITQLNLKIQKLKYECPDICSFRDKFIFEKPEPVEPDPVPEEPEEPVEPDPVPEPPHIEDNIIPLTTDSTPQALPYEEVIKGIALDDASSVQIVEKSSIIDLYVNDLPVQENYSYPAGISFSAKLNSDFMFETFMEEGVCKIARIDRNSLNQSIADGYTVVGLDPSGNVKLQSLTPNLNFKTINSTIYDSVKENFKVKVLNTEDDNLWSNIAVIDLIFSPICKPNECSNKNTEVVSKHSESFVLSMDEIYGGTIDKIKIKNITFNSGILLFNGQDYISDSNLEVVVTREDLLNNLITWRPLLKTESKLFIEFTIPTTNDFNYCDISSTFELTKLEGDG